MKLAVALLTCDRYDYTVKTVESLLEHNDTSEWALFHADDASTDERVVPYVQSKGFQTVVANKERIGCSPTTDALLQETARRVGPDTLVLYLQNDFVSVRMLPVDVVACAFAENPNLGWFQLFYRRPRTKHFRRATWQPTVIRDEAIHVKVGSQGLGVGFHPCIARAGVYADAARGAHKEWDFVRRVIASGLQVIRVDGNVCKHIGTKQTPNGLYGGRKQARTREARDPVERMSMTPVERNALVRVTPKQGRFLEVGTWAGQTVRYLATLRPAAYFLSVDPFPSTRRYRRQATKWGRSDPGRGCITGVLSYWREQKLHNTSLFVGTLADLDAFAPDSLFDVVLVDGLHTYEACFEDLQQGERHVRSGGVLAVHDYGNIGGVNAAVDQFCAETGWQIDRHEETLVFLRRSC
jgi:SAM-dependent methyltransferase